MVFKGSIEHKLIYKRYQVEVVVFVPFNGRREWSDTERRWGSGTVKRRIPGENVNVLVKMPKSRGDEVKNIGRLGTVSGRGDRLGLGHLVTN